MPTRYFTVEEANALLPNIKPVLGELLERRARIVRSRNEVTSFLRSGDSDVGGREASELVREFMKMEKLILKIRSHDIVLKDLNVGLIDFLSERDGREVYLCWRYGEPKVDFYHELHTGFNDRQHL